VTHCAPVFLGIETSGPATGVALVTAERLLYEKVSDGGARHNEQLLPLIQEAAAKSSVAITSLAGIGVAIGPGMFTALRVGLSVAKGLALAHGLPVKGVNTLWALAATAAGLESLSARPVLALIDARKHQVYAALYCETQTVLAPAVVAPAELPRLLAAVVPRTDWLLLVGDGAELCRTVLESAGIATRWSGIRTPSPRVVAQAAARLIPVEGGADLAALEPCYLRRTDAELRRMTE